MKIEEMDKRKKVLIDLMNESFYVPMKIKELAIFLQVAKEDRHELEEVLKALIYEGKIEITKKGKYQKARKKFLEGTFLSHSKGFGFVENEDWEEDVYIAEENTVDAMHQDKVQIVLIPSKGGRRQEGKVVKVLERGTRQIVGLFEKSKGFGFVIPDNSRFTQDIFIAKEHTMGAENGHKVLVELTSYGSDSKSPEGIVIKILGHKKDPGTDILSVVYSLGLPNEFPEEVLKETSQVPDAVSEEEKQGRLDLRELMMVTIDGEDAKDLDDGVSLEITEQGYRLGVHIADVSHYVKEDRPLDKEARERGTSIYLTDRVIPMLPHRLSNGICSLNQGVDRLALSCIMELDKQGNVIGHRIAETVICINRRMSYTSVKKILVDQDPEEIANYQELVPMFQEMEKVSALLRAKRYARGSIDFDFPESKIILNEKGKPIDIKPYDRNVATKMIEDFMLAANETVAEDFFWQSLPFVYRTHEEPSEEKIQELSEFIRNFGYGLHSTQDGIHPKELQKLLRRIEGSPEEALISRLTLRSMRQARYATACTGHFGLAAKYYCHFTSPIRRYPDLQIHRIIKENLHGRLDEKRVAHYDEILEEVALHSSKMERRADEAERMTDKMKKAEYMQEHIGETFEGVISGITSYGIYVELPNTIEGMVHVNNMLDDRYNCSEDKFEMVGSHTGKVYKLGEQVSVYVLSAEKQSGTIDFIFPTGSGKGEKRWGKNQ